MTNYSFPSDLGAAFNLADRFSDMDKAQIACAFDNIIAHFAEIAINAQGVLMDDEPISEREINDIERLAHEKNEPELAKFADWMTMYVPEVPSDALVAALYIHNEFLPPEDDYTAGDEPEFIEDEHGEDAQKYYDALVDLQFGNPRKDYVTEEEFRMAAKISIVMAIYGDMDVAEHTDFPTALRNTSMEKLNLQYERAMSLKNIVGELDVPLDKFFDDYMEELEEAIDDKARGTINVTPTKPNTLGLK